MHEAISALGDGRSAAPIACTSAHTCRLAKALESPRAIQELKAFYKEERLALPLFLVKVVLGGVVCMMLAATLCAHIPETTIVDGRPDNAAYLFAPCVYAAGTAVLGSTLFHETYEQSGVIASIKSMQSHSSVVVGAVVAFLLMALGSLDWNDLLRLRVQETKKDGTPTVMELLMSDASLLISVILNFLGDAFMVDECFEYKAMRGQHRQVTKMLIDNVVLIAVLAMKARQKKATGQTILKFTAIMSLVYTVCVLIGVGMMYIQSEAFQVYLRGFNKGFVPLVLLWTLLFELAPNVFGFHVRGSGGVGGVKAPSLYAQRHLVVSAVGVVLFYFVANTDARPI